MTKKQRIAIDEILDNFDFKTVYRVMKLLNWSWFDHNSKTHSIPCGSRLKKTAEQRLINSLEYNTSSSGGFVARFENDTLSLEFILSEYDVDVEPYE